MAKQFLAVEDLTRLVLEKIRHCRQGRHVREISIYELESGDLGRNWGVTIVSPGKRGVIAAGRALSAVMSELGPSFDLSAETECVPLASADAAEEIACTGTPGRGRYRAQAARAR
jgi:hypothetical protein